MNDSGYRTPPPPPPSVRYAKASNWYVHPKMSNSQQPDSNMKLTFDKNGKLIAVELIS